MKIKVLPFLSIIFLLLFSSIVFGYEGVCFYEKINYGGKKACWEIGENYDDLYQLEYQGIYWDDEISSVKVFGKARPSFYDGPGYKGKRVDLYKSCPNLSRISISGRKENWNDRISSLWVYSAENWPGVNALHSNWQINPGKSLISINGRFKLVLQNDGNMVLYDKDKSTWTAGIKINRCLMKPDGNLVLYNSSNQQVWESGTSGKPGARLVLENNGNLVIYHKSTQVWASDTGR